MKSSTLLRNRTLLFGDIFLIAASGLASYVLRLNFGERLADFGPQILTMILLAAVVKPLVYSQFGLYRRMWIYAGTQELILIAIAVTFASVGLFVSISLIQLLKVFDEVSRGAVVIDWLLSLICVGGLRFSFRIMAEDGMTFLSPKGSQRRARRTSLLAGKAAQGRLRRVLVVGAGDAGALVIREMQKNPQSNLFPVCFVDDDPAKQSQEIHGVPVVGLLKDLPRVAESNAIDEVIIAIPSASGKVVRVVADLCRLKGIPFRTMPGLHELIDGKVSVNRLREVEITDLLRREPVRIDDQLVGASLSGRKVLVSGAGGSIGRELCRQVARWSPSALVLLGHGENSIFEILLELQENYPNLLIHPVIADIRDWERLGAVFSLHKPQVVFHAAAHKHVPLMETNIEEAVTNNILGTRNVVERALENAVERLVMISSDKAVCPSSVMGASKRMAEMLVVDAALRSGAAFSVVRFGNVLGSRGSVIHLFKRQIAAGGPVTLTHPEMHRYFMTIPEAVHLVLQASAMGKGSEIFVLNMGEQVRILDLVEDLVRLSGLEPGKDIEITITGIRPGEKLREALWDEGADYCPTAHPDILRLEADDAGYRRLTSEMLSQAVDELARLAALGKVESIVQQFNHLIPGASIQVVLPGSVLAPSDMTSLV